MAVPTAMAKLLLRSPDCTWNRERWLQLPDDGNRYEVIAGVLCCRTEEGSYRRAATICTDPFDDACFGSRPAATSAISKMRSVLGIAAASSGLE